MGNETTRVLIADDSALMRLSIQKMISEAGYEVVAVAENGKDAVTKAISTKPQMALLDVNMPVANGIYALQKIMELFPDTVAVMMTSDSDPVIVEQCMEAGAAGYVLKDDAKENILATISECWENNA